MNPLRKFKKDTVALLFFVVLGALLYLPILNNCFLSDDYDSLYRVTVEKRIIYREFLRPLIDISFFLNYFLFHLHPFGYYLFNLAVHAANCVMIYRVGSRLSFVDSSERQMISVMAAVLFMVYPFHNESVVWLTARLSSMACLCALFTIYYSLRESVHLRQFLLSAFFYLLGLFAYESIIMLPFLILILNLGRYKNPRLLVRDGLSWACVILFYLVTRYLMAGKLVPEYGNRLTAASATSQLAPRFLKTLGRCLLPPMQDSADMMRLFVIGLALGLALHLVLWIWRKPSLRFSLGYGALAICLVASLSLPAFFGVSTKTSEGDRLLYFPSVFLCLMISALICLAIKKLGTRLLLLFVLSGAGIFFLEKNNANWKKASDAAASIVAASASNPAGHVFLINLPEEIDGAFVFRNAFSRALLINQIDTARVTVVSQLSRDEGLQSGGAITPKEQGQGNTQVGPAVSIHRQAAAGTIENEHSAQTWQFNTELDIVYCWDKYRLNRVILK